MDALLRRRIMLGFRETPTPPTPGPSLIYSIESPISTSNYDTGVKLFDTPKSFSILCDATWNNYNSGSWKNGVFGISTGNYFRFGTIGNGKDYSEDVQVATANRYSAMIMNTSSSGLMCTSLFGRSTSSVDEQRRFAVRYNHQTRVIEAFRTVDATVHWYTVPGDVSSLNTLKLLVNSMSGTINVFKIYDGVIDISLINDFIGGN